MAGGPRVRSLNDRSPERGGRYVLCWLQQALRARDNPVIDAARLGNACRLPVLVYHGVRKAYPYASDRLHRFILGAGIDVDVGCEERGLACIRHIDRAGAREKGLVNRLAADAAAAAVVLKDQPSFASHWQAERVAARASAPGYAVNAACLVPPAVLGDGIGGRFLRRHEPERAAWSAWDEETPDLSPYAGPLPFAPDRPAEGDQDALIAGLAIDHSLAPSDTHPAGRTAAEARLVRATADVLPGCAAARNDATRVDGASGLSPCLHFGVLGPREVMQVVSASGAGGQHRAKFTDELLGLREWFHTRREHWMRRSGGSAWRPGRARCWRTMPPTRGPKWRRSTPCRAARRATRRGTRASASSSSTAGCTTTCGCTGPSGLSR